MSAPLTIGTIFLLIGIFGFIFSQKNRFRYLTPFIVGSILMLLYMIGPLSNKDQRIKDIKNIRPNNVSSFILGPSTHKDYETIDLASANLYVNDRKLIARLCAALNAATSTQFSNHIPDSVARLIIKLKDGSQKEIGVRKNGPSIVLEISSKGEYGWIYGYLSADGVGEVIRGVRSNESDGLMPK